MKKLISYLLITAILLGCVSPAVITSAAGYASLAAESVEIVEGSGTAVTPAVTIENNPGISYLSFLVYYCTAELEQGDEEAALLNSVFSDEDSNISFQRKGTNSNVKAYIPEDVREKSSAFIVELWGLNGEDTVYDDGIVIELPFNIVSEDTGTFSYTVVVIEACGADGESVTVEGTAGAVSYTSDPLTGVYGEFTVFTDPGNTEVLIGTESIDVDVRFDCNPGLWGTRFYIVYPEALTLSDGGETPSAKIENSLRIYTEETDMVRGIPDLPLDDSRQPQTFIDVLEADPSIVREGYHSTTVYFEPSSYSMTVTGDGVLCTLHFDIAEGLQEGDVLDIRIYYGEADFIGATYDEAVGVPVFTKHTPATVGADITMVELVCDHVEGDAVVTDPTCTELGVIAYKCSLCGRTVRKEYIPATGHNTNGDVVTVAPTCLKDGTKTTYCSICGEASAVEIIKSPGTHTPGADATCTEPQLCLACNAVIMVPLGHTEGLPVVEEPTCTQEGEEAYYCIVCSVHTRTEIIPAKGHTVILGSCTVCGETELVPEELIYTVSNGTVTITGYAGTEKDLYIPATIDGYPVRTVADTLYKNSSIKSIYLSDNIERLIISVSGSAKLEALYINGIGTNITVQGSYTSSSGISNVFYAGTPEEYNSYIGSVNYFANVICNAGTPMEGFIYTVDEDCGTITITGYSGLSTDLVIPAEFKGYRVTAIDPLAFAGRTDITSISIPGTVEFVEERSFEGCTGLRNVIFGEGICEIGDYAFSGCTSLEEVILPESVVYIWAYAFNKCTSLVSVYLPSTLAAIEYKAFYRCENIYSVTYNGSPSEFEEVYMGNGNDPITMTEIEYLEKDEIKTVSIPIPEGMDPADCRLYYVDENGVATELSVEIVDGCFVVVSDQGTGYYMVRDASGGAADILVGDMDGDGSVTPSDANALQRILSGKADAPDGSDQYIAADINGDGFVNASDMNMLKRLIVGVITL